MSENNKEAKLQALKIASTKSRNNTAKEPSMRLNEGPIAKDRFDLHRFHFIGCRVGYRRRAAWTSD